MEITSLSLCNFLHVKSLLEIMVIMLVIVRAFYTNEQFKSIYIIFFKILVKNISKIGEELIFLKLFNVAQTFQANLPTTWATTTSRSSQSMTSSAWLWNPTVCKSQSSPANFWTRTGSRSTRSTKSFWRQTWTPKIKKQLSFWPDLKTQDRSQALVPTTQTSCPPKNSSLSFSSLEIAIILS